MSRCLVLCGGIVLLLTAACGGATGVQDEADAAAASAADDGVRVALAEAIDAAGAVTPADRTEAALSWLGDPDLSPQATRGAWWAVVGRDGTRIRVDLHLVFTSAALLPPDQGESAWGLACRTYDVADGVRSTPVECPDDTPRNPTACDLTDDGSLVC